MTDLLRAIAALALTVAAYRHAALWGRFFFNLYGLRAQALVSYGYLRLNHRLIVCHLLHAVLLVGIWLTWPIGHWGILALLVSAAAYRGGMRRAMLRSFVRQLLMHLKDGVPFEEAWQNANSTIKALTRIRNLNVDRYLADPKALIHYVAAKTSGSEGSEIEESWMQWVHAQPDEDGT